MTLRTAPPIGQWTEKHSNGYVVTAEPECIYVADVGGETAFLKPSNTRKSLLVSVQDAGKMRAGSPKKSKARSVVIRVRDVMKEQDEHFLKDFVIWDLENSTLAPGGGAALLWACSGSDGGARFAAGACGAHGIRGDGAPACGGAGHLRVGEPGPTSTTAWGRPGQEWLSSCPGCPKASARPTTTRSPKPDPMFFCL